MKLIQEDIETKSGKMRRRIDKKASECYEYINWLLEKRNDSQGSKGRGI